jgi:hypothetical protein
MTTTYTTNLRLKITDTLTADAVYNLERIDTLAGNIYIAYDGSTKLMSATDIVIEPQSAGLGGTLGTGVISLGTEFNSAATIDIHTSELDFNQSPMVNMALADAKLFIGNGSGVAVPLSITGDISVANTGVAAISSGVIVNDDISGSAAIAWSKINKTGSNLNEIATRSHTVLTDIGSNTHDEIDTHIASNSNPHSVTKDQVLSGDLVDNDDISATAAIAWTKLSKTGSNLNQITTRSHALLADIGSNTHAQIDTHLANTSNPHSVSYTQTGAAAAVHTHDDRYYTETEVDNLLATKSDTAHHHDADYSALGHIHDARYYTETEMDGLLANKSDVGHTHDDRYYTETEVDALFLSISDPEGGTVHNHDYRYYTETEVDALLAGLDTSDGPTGQLIEGGTWSYTDYQPDSSFFDLEEQYVVDSNQVVSQSFVASKEAVSIVKAHFSRGFHDTVSGDLYCKIYAVDGSGKPTGAALATSSNALDTSTLIYESFDQFSFNFTGVSLTIGNSYAVVFDFAAVTFGSGAAVFSLFGTTIGEYANGTCWVSLDGGSSWSVEFPPLSFEIYETLDVKRLSWSEDAYVSFVGLYKNRNTIAAGYVDLEVGEVAYVSCNSTAGGTEILTVSVGERRALDPAVISNYAQIAHLTSDGIILGDGYQLFSGDSQTLYGYGESDLGVPAVDGYVLTSTTSGTRSWAPVTVNSSGDLSAAALTIAPGASVTPANNGEIMFELTDNTTLTIKAKGSDGVVRSGTVTLA